jgi:tetratricopeptide (TPR) repeat protein
MVGWRVALWLGLASLWLAGASLGRAQEAQTNGAMSEARALFMAGRVAFDEARYESALKHFEASYELSQRTPLLYNIAQCHDRLRRDEQAIAAFERYLAAEPNPENRALVEARVKALRELVTARARATPGSAGPAQPAQTPAEQPGSAQEPVSPGRRFPLGPMLTVAGGAALGLTGGLLMTFGARRGEDVEQAELGSSYQALRADLDAAERQWLAGQILVGTAAATVVGGLVWWFFDRRESRAGSTGGAAALGTRHSGRASTQLAWGLQRVVISGAF